MQLECFTALCKCAGFQTVDSVAWKLGEGDIYFSQLPGNVNQY